MKRIFSLCVLIMVFSIATLADIRLPPTATPTASPKEKKAIDTTLSIRLDKNAKEARLIIPKSQIKQLRAELEQLDNDSNVTAQTGFTRTQTIVGGLFLSLGMVFGGVWFARSRKKELKPNKAVAVGAILFFSGAFATIAYANMGPPFETRSITGKIFTPAVHQYKQASGKIKLETTDTDSGVQLIVPDVPDDKKTDE